MYMYAYKQESTSKPVLMQEGHQNVFFDDIAIEGSDVPTANTTEHGHIPLEMEGYLGV